MMVVYLFYMLTFFVKTRNLQLTSIEKRPLVWFLRNSKVLCLKHVKIIDDYYFGVSVCALIVFNCMIGLIN